MTMPRIEVITSVQRRRRWSRDEKERLVAACFEPGMTVSRVAQSAGIHSSQLFRWRKELCSHSGDDSPHLVPVQIAQSASRSPTVEGSGEQGPGAQLSGLIEIELRCGRIVRVGRDFESGTLSQVLDVLERG